MTTRDIIHKTTFTVEVFSRGPYDDYCDLSQIQYDITEGDCIGNYFSVSQEIVDPAEIESEMIRIGNDGDFFDDGLDDDDDLTWDPMEHRATKGFCAKCGGACEYS